jgi:hypothetical protein
MVQQAPVASNVLGTPWPTLWGQRDLHGTVIAWTNHSFVSSGSPGKGGGQVAGGEKDFRTFALGLCIGPVDRITQIWYDNKLIWSGNVSITSANADGYVLLTSNDNRGTIAFYFGATAQNQDAVLKQFIPDAPFYRGMCYAVFHGARNGTRGFRIGNADTLAQVSIRVTRTPPAPPGTPFTASIADNPLNPTNFSFHSVIRTADATSFAGGGNVVYKVSVAPPPPDDDSTANISVQVADGYDPGGAASFLITSGTPFAVGSFGLMMTISWDTSHPLSVAIHGSSMGWTLQVVSLLIAANGAPMTAALYELLTSPVHGITLDPALIDLDGFRQVIGLTTNIGISFVVDQKDKAQQLAEDMLKNFQGALVISNGLLGPKLLIGGGNPVLTLESNDVIGVRIRPGAWYELPQHVTVKYPDVARKFRDTVVSLPGAGDFGDDEKSIEIDLPMITDANSARLIGTRLRMIEALPKTPDTVTCGRAAFSLQFGDVVAINDPERDFDPNDSFVIVGIREHGAGDETIELDIVPNVFGHLPIGITVTGITEPGTRPTEPGQPILPVAIQDAFELPFEFAPDGSKRFIVFAARPAPDAQGFSLYASIEQPAVDYDLVDSEGLFTAGGTIVAANLSAFTMERGAYIDFDQSSDDIAGFSSLSDTDWFAYKLLVLIGSGDAASLYAARELIFLGANRWRLRGLAGPLSDTLPGNGTGHVWIFRLQPPYNVLAEPAWVNGSVVTFKAIPFGSRLSPSLAQAFEAAATVLSRAIRPRAAVNLNANGRGAIHIPAYTSDIALAWDLCNRSFGFGAETNPSEFDPSIESEIDSCDVEIWVGGILVRTEAIEVRHGTAITSVDDPGDPPNSSAFDVVDTTGFQSGDRIGVTHGSGEWFGRIASSSSGISLVLISPLSITPSPGDVVTRYEAVGYIYDAATNTADNGSLADEVLVKVYPKLNGLRALNAAEITVVKT